MNASPNIRELIFIKIMKGVFPQILGHEIEDLDDVNIRTSIRNFEKI